jgi:thiol-disulfide isomerase/thioredoxin
MEKSAGLQMKWVLACGFFGVMSLALFQGVRQSMAPPADMDPKSQPIVPDFHLEGIQTKSVDLSEIPAKLTILHFWARWCGVCMSELPHLVQFVSENQKKGLQVIGINKDDHPDIMVPRVVVDYGLNFPNYADKGEEIAGYFNLRGLPMTVFYNKKRQVLAVQPGEVPWTGASLQKRIEAWISDSSND